MSAIGIILSEPSKRCQTKVRRKRSSGNTGADHLPLIDAKIASGTWFHKSLCESASCCLGIDINRQAADYIRGKYGYEVLCRDIENEDIPEITGSRWDFIVLGEVIEHLDSPVRFLRAPRPRNDTGHRSPIEISAGS